MDSFLSRSYQNTSAYRFGGLPRMSPVEHEGDACQSSHCKKDEQLRVGKLRWVSVEPRNKWRSLFAALAAAVPAYCPAVHGTELPRRPIRIVSINMCTDELVLRLADVNHIASVSYLARAPNSSVAELAARVPINHGLAEEIVPLNPDLVVAGIYTARTTVDLLKRVNAPLLDLDVPRSLDEVREQYLAVGKALGEPERAQRLVAEMDARLAALPPVGPPPLPRALVFNSNGYTVGKQSLTDDIISRAGMENLARALGINSFGRVALETVVLKPVDVLIVSSWRDGPPAIATEIMNHPVLQKISDRTRIVMPSKLVVCAGPENVDAIALLQSAAAGARAEAPRE
jgi:iron complex transport system substrate-binding protein